MSLLGQLIPSDSAANSWLGPVGALMSSVTWATGSSAYSKVSKAATPFAVNLTRACIAFVLFTAIHFIFSENLAAAFDAIFSLQASNVGWMAVSILSCYVIGDVLFLRSTHFLGVPGGLAIASCYPIWTALVGAIFDGQNLGWVKWLGLLVSVTGIVLVVLNTPEDSGSHKSSGPSRRSLGVLFALGASLCWASNTYSVAKGSQGISIELGNMIRMFFGILMIPLMSQVFAKNQPRFVPAKALKPFLWIFIFESVCGSYFFVVGLQKASLVVASTLASLAPVIAVPIGWMMRTEKFNLARTAGVFSVVVGLSLLMGILS
ncbi:MAG: DMT family transporter [Bdellovibrionales bacterium]|nr:DMT family transporter [Bdellovibrionales bacterium]